MVQINVSQEKRVLSIQSHVVCGYVGYGRWGGSKFDAAHLQDIFAALDVNGLFRQSHLLTGYIPGADALSVVAKTVDRLRAINPSLIYVLDPVMGDEGRIYVSESVIPIYKSLMPKSSCATPNYFEAELLTDVKIVDAASLRLALRTFHERYRIPHVVISAVPLPRTELPKLGLVAPDSSDKMLVCAGSSMLSASGRPLETVSFGIAFPELAEHYEGVGDVFSSLILARFPSLIPDHTHLHPISPLARTTELAIASLQGVIAHTRTNALRLAGGDASLLVGGEGEGAEARVKRLRMVELRLIHSQKEIRDPTITFPATRF